MTQGPGGQSPPQQQYGSGSPSKPETAKDEAREVASTAADRGGEVAQTAADQAKHVAAHAQQEARDLLREGREQLQSQARDGQRKAAESLHQLAGQLERMAEQTDSPGLAGDVARQVSDRTRTVADWLEHREPGDLLDEVRRFARRRPGTFLVGAAVAGALVGRLTRGVVAQHKEESSSNGHAGAPQPHAGPAATPAVPQPDAGYATPELGIPQPGYAAPGGYNAPQPTEGLPQPSRPAGAPGGYNAPQAPDALPQPSPRFSAPGQVP
ncbi:hypothetical protein [Amycolatopsis rifamycinica]|uniref:Uncharacterized protein n=1 Tax=Amycolatopsis rifamycinica TaxID=287986 RepID=A0A066UAQ0_9PSEU|nr:hypothetical protein [Amycolatopsis rifamycinica]KDN22962.1 hypothetical protein DV20_06715 [Amycolatopsis rifamycinica]